MPWKGIHPISISQDFEVNFPCFLSVAPDLEFVILSFFLFLLLQHLPTFLYFYQSSYFRKMREFPLNKINHYSKII